MIEKIQTENTLIAIIIRNNFSKDGASFVTDNKLTQQLAAMSYKKDHKITPHYHQTWTRTVDTTMEAIIIKSGKLRVDFYSQTGSYFQSKLLEEKDLILLVTGGHGFKVIEDVEMIEVKQGPFVKDDRVFITEVIEEKIKF